jgi:hypothetical protein
MQAFRFLWAGLLLLSQVAAGQSFTYRASLGTVPANSFYRVLLPPAITGHLQPGFPDIRLYDQLNREVPYLLVRQEQEAPGGRDRYLPVTGLRFRQYGSLQHKKTILRFSAARPVLIDQLVFTIAAPSLYHRQAILYQRREDRSRRRKGRLPRDYQPVTQFVLAANKNNTLLLSGFRVRDFYVEIQNGDNPPLVVKKVVAYQMPTYLVAALTEGNRYHLAFGSKDPLAPPAYDLSYFRDKIPRQIPTLRPREIKFAAAQEKRKGNFMNAFFTSRYLIWGALLVVIAFLAYMSYKMLKETGKEGKA